MKMPNNNEVNVFLFADYQDQANFYDMEHRVQFHQYRATAYLIFMKEYNLVFSLICLLLWYE
jgi:hypothetical protein